MMGEEWDRFFLLCYKCRLMAGGMAQEVDCLLPCKWEALNSNPSTANKYINK
jgi:hypothetical protein